MLRTLLPTMVLPGNRCEAATGHRGRPCLRERLAWAVRAMRLWPSWRRERRALADLVEAAESSDHLLRDIGLSRGEAWAESAKPFWRP